MPYLTIKDYESEQEAYRDCLSKLTELHQRFKENVDRKCKDRKHALYLLTATSISTAYAAFDLHSKGFGVSVYQFARFILEAHSLVEYFIVIPDEVGGDIDKWFNGELIETRYKKKTKHKVEKVIDRKSTVPFKALPKDDLLKREEITQKNFETLSRFSHPTIYSTIKPKTCDFARLILIPVVDMCVDAQRMHFFPKDSTTGLMFSEFRLLFEEFRKHD